MKPTIILLSSQDRERLEKILNSETTTKNDKTKAQALLFADSGEDGGNLSSQEIASQLSFSLRTLTRIKAVYAKNSSIEDIFAFAGLSEGQRKIDNLRSAKLKNPSPLKKRRERYIEVDNSSNETFLTEGVKCRVTLNQNERDELEKIIKSGKQTVRKFNRAKILLLADEGSFGPALSDSDISIKLEVSLSTIARVRRLLVTKGKIKDVLNFNHQNAGRAPKLDGVVQANLIALVCGPPPEGKARWTLRLLADRLVELQIVESISHTVVGKALKKMNLSLGKEKNG
jgi:hypothetical protein